MAQQKAEALYEFNPTAPVELKLKKGDVILVRRMNVGDGWWEGELNGKRGLFPSSYVKLLPLESPSHSHEKDRPITPITPATPLTPGTSKKAYMEPLLVPPTHDPQYNKEKASELFIKGHSDIGVTVGPSWDCQPPKYSITVRYQKVESRSSSVKRWSTYLVETKQLACRVTRKFKHFLWLYDKLAELFPCISLPPLPVKQYSGPKDPDGLEARRRGLERYLKRVAGHPVLGSTKLFHAFLTAKDDKDWKIGRHSTTIKLPKSAKKLFGAPIYNTIKYPAYNVPLTQLTSIEKFSKFSHLLEMGVQTLENSYLHVSMTNVDMLNSLNLLGTDIQRFTKGLQPTSAAKRRKLMASTSVPAIQNGVGQAGFRKSLLGPHAVQKPAPLGDGDGEQSEEEEEGGGGGGGGGEWNWREDERFSKLTQDLQDIAGGMRQLSHLGMDHREALETQVVDVLRDYSGIIHTLPVLVKLHEEAMELFNASKEKGSKKEAEVVRTQCDTLNNILLSEFDHFSDKMVQDFETMMESFLQEQANFHRQLADEWDNLHRRYSRRLSSRSRQSAKAYSSSGGAHSVQSFEQPHRRSGSFTGSYASSRGSSASLPDLSLPGSRMEEEPPPSSSHFNDSFDETDPPDGGVVPSYINVQPKTMTRHSKGDLSESDVIDPEMLKPKMKKSLPDLPPRAAANADISSAESRPAVKTPPLPAPTLPAPDPVEACNPASHHQYSTCVIPGSEDNSIPIPAATDPAHHQYETCTPKEEVTPPLDTVDISGRYETAFPHHLVTVPMETTTPTAPSPEYVNLPHVTSAGSGGGGDGDGDSRKDGILSTTINKSPSASKKPMPIQRKQPKSDESPSEAPVADVSKSPNVSPACSILEVSKPLPPTSVSKKPLPLSNASKKPLPPVKPPKLTNSHTNVTAADSTRLSGNEGVVDVGGADDVITGKVRPHSSGLAESCADSAVEPSDFAETKPRSYTATGAADERLGLIGYDPLFPPPPPSSPPPPPPPTSSPPPSNSAAHPGLVVLGQIRPTPDASLNVQESKDTHHQTTPPTLSNDSPHSMLKPKVKMATRPSPPTKARVPNPLPQGSVVQSMVPTKTKAVTERTAQIGAKATPPPKPPRGLLSRAGSGRTNRVEEDPSPEGREELMRKLSKRRMRIEKQLSATSASSSARTGSPTSTTLTSPTSSNASSGSLGGGGEGGGADRISGLSTSSSLSEVVVAYHCKSPEGGVASSYPSSSNGRGQDHVIIEEPSAVVRREKDDSLASIGIIEDGESTVI